MTFSVGLNVVDTKDVKIIMTGNPIPISYQNVSLNIVLKKTRPGVKRDPMASTNPRNPGNVEA